MRWASSGQGPILVRRAEGAAFEPLQASAVPLGLAEHLIIDPAPELSLGPGGMVAAMTDGVFEARSPSGELLGADRVARILEQHAGLGPPELIGKLQVAVQSWQEGDRPADDQTIVIVRRAD
jgi:sigma-B regulation protein RsbU (phosphoserine phosphatase)